MVAKQIRKIEGVSPGLTGKEIAGKKPRLEGILRMRKGQKLLGKNALSDWENVAPLLQELVKLNGGGLPSHKWLYENGFGRLAFAILRHHGGIGRVRVRLGLEQKRKVGDKSLKDWENLKAELQPIVDELGGMPTANWLQENGHSSLSVAISIHHGGFVEVGKRIGKEQAGHGGVKSLKHWENLESILFKIIGKEGGRVTQTWLEKNGYGNVSRAIYIHHGGFDAVRKRMGVETDRLTGEVSYKHWENAEPILLKLIDEHGQLPSWGWLKKNGYSKLLKAISKHHGGINGIRNKLRELGILKDQPSSTEIFQQLKGAMDSETIQ
jgi:hypothetical protein